jgi:hypothetical protein
LDEGGLTEGVIGNTSNPAINDAPAFVVDG